MGAPHKKFFKLLCDQDEKAHGLQHEMYKFRKHVSDSIMNLEAPENMHRVFFHINRLKQRIFEFKENIEEADLMAQDIQNDARGEKLEKTSVDHPQITLYNNTVKLEDHADSLRVNTSRVKRWTNDRMIRMKHPAKTLHEQEITLHELENLEVYLRELHQMMRGYQMQLDITLDAYDKVLERHKESNK